MKTTKKLILSLSLLLVPQIAFSGEFGYDSEDELSSLNYSIVSNTSNNSNNRVLAEDSEDSESQSDEESAEDDLQAQPRTAKEMLKSAHHKLKTFQKQHPSVVSGSAIAGGALAAVGGAVVTYKKSSLVKSKVDKAAEVIKEGVQNVTGATCDAWTTAKDYIAKKAGATRTAVDGEIETLDNTYFSRADAIVVAGSAVAAVGAYKAAPVIKDFAVGFGSWAKDKASEASSSDAAINAQVYLQATVHWIQDHKAVVSAPVAALAAGFAAYKGYKAYAAKKTAEVAVTEETESASVDLN